MPRRRASIPSDLPSAGRTTKGAYDDVVLGGPLVRGGGTIGGRKSPGSMAATPSGSIRPEFMKFMDTPYDDYMIPDMEGGEEDSAERTRGSMATLTDAPTSSTNPSRPRTLAAGYSSSTKTLSVVFRDGTNWNYYEVGALEWANFKRAKSKGRFIRLYLDNKPYGPPRDQGYSFTSSKKSRA